MISLVSRVESWGVSFEGLSSIWLFVVRVVSVGFSVSCSG